MSAKRKKLRLSDLSGRDWIFAGLVMLLSIVFVIAGYLRGKQDTPKSYNAEYVRRDIASKSKEDRIRIATKMAYDAFAKGDVDGATVIYDQAIAVERDMTAKVKLAINESEQLYVRKKYENALSVAKKAESYSTDKFLIADWLGRLYMLEKKYDKAAEYYMLAASLANSPTNTAGFTKEDYASKAYKMKVLYKDK